MPDQTKDWVLDSNSVVTLSDYQKRKLAESYQKLERLTVEGNQKMTQKVTQARVYEMSLRQLGENFVRTWAEIMPEFYMWLSSQRNLTDLIEIFVQEDRLIYVGIMCILVSLFCYFFLLPE